MLDLIAMWKSPKMIALMLLTALLYPASLYPLQGFTFFRGYADFGRMGVGIPVAFSFLFGPAAAWGAAFGNLLRDIVEFHLDAASFFGFFGNLLLGYVPYKLWKAITAEKPDMRSIKRFAVFVGVAVSACIICGLIIGWGLYWLGFTPFMPTAAIIAVTNMLWAIVIGGVILALSYNYVSKRKLLYTDILNIQQTKPAWSLSRTLAIIIFAVATVACFAVGFNASPFVLLPFVALAVIAIGLALR